MKRTSVESRIVRDLWQLSTNEPRVSMHVRPGWMGVYLWIDESSTRAVHAATAAQGRLPGLVGREITFLLPEVRP